MTETNDLFLQQESLTIEADDTKWKSLLKLKIPPDKKLYINHIIAEVSSAGTPEGYFNFIVNGEKLVGNFACYSGIISYYFWGKTQFVLTIKDTLEIQVKSTGVATEAEASVAGLLFPIPK
jgi:hypothetical protein